MTKAAVLSAAFFGLILPLFSGCAGGCGDGPSAGGQEPPAAPASGAGAHGGGSGVMVGSEQPQAKDGAPQDQKRFGTKYGGPSQQSAFDSAGLNTSRSGMQQLGAVAGEAVPPSDFRSKVLDPRAAAVLLTVSGSNCPDCSTATPVVSSLAPKFVAWRFYTLDGMAVGASGLLPPGLALSPLPAFAIYERGRPTSTLQGLPFPRQVDAKGNFTESVGEYQARLKHWFRDALVQKNLRFASSLRPAPAPKN